jgi:hypothetical protein
MAKFPEPPAALTVPAELVTLPLGTLLWRVYSRGSTHPAQWNDFRFFGPTASRFDHHDGPPQVQTKGILYDAQSPVTCLAEVFQAARVIDTTARDPWLVGFETIAELTLLNLMGSWPTRAGGSMAINSGPRPRARRWSTLIAATYPNVQGLCYASSMHANAPSVALYERARAALPARPAFHRALADPTLRLRLAQAAAELGYLII